MTDFYDKAGVEARRKLAEKLYLAGSNLTEIAEHPEIDRSKALMTRWKQQGKWEDKRAMKLAKSAGVTLQIKPSTKKELEEVLKLAEIDLESDKPLNEREASTLATIATKMLFKRLLTDIHEGRINYKTPAAAHEFIFSFVKEMKLAQGLPTEIHEHRAILPPDDADALMEGLKRLKVIADRRRKV